MILNIEQNTIIQLGRHYLVYGDATNPEPYELLKQHQNKPVSLLLTDPPYNVNYKGTSKSRRKRIINDNLGLEFGAFLTSFLTQSSVMLAPGTPYYIFMADSSLPELYDALSDSDLYRSGCLVWAKHHFTLSFADYKKKHELIVYGWKKGGKHTFYGPKNASTVLYYKRPINSKFHPTQKPIDLVTELIVNSTLHDDVVLDPFGGSGTTLLAAQESGRCASLIELDIEYIQTIINRFRYLYPDEVIRIIK